MRERTLTLPSELSFWELESQWTLEFSKGNCKGQNSLDWIVPYIIGKLFERRCLKWARMTHLDTWNTSYGQMKGWESNWQFDSQPLKVKNRPNFLVCRWLAKYYRKALNKGYKFALNLISIRGLHTKLWAPKVLGVPTLEILGLPLGSPRKKWHLNAGPVARHKVYYKGEGGGFPQVRAVVSLVSPSLPVARLNTKSVPSMHQPTCCLVCASCVSDWLLIILLSFMSELQHTPLPPKCCEPGSVPQLFILSLFSLQTHIWI